MKLIYFGLFLLAIYFVFQSFIPVKALYTEKQKYRTVLVKPAYEIRFYPAATFATVYSDATNYKSLSNNGFRKLAGFIFGGNKQNESIAMTAPVRMSMSEKGSSMSFVLPEKYDTKNIPTPNNTEISIQKSTPEYVAVISFSGYASDEKIKDYNNKLVQILYKENIKIKGPFNFLGYNAPFQFIGRTNEIIIPIEWKE
jgi:hypothetical protein